MPLCHHLTPRFSLVARIVIHQLFRVKLTERRRESRARCRKQGSNKEGYSGDHGRRMHVAVDRAMIRCDWVGSRAPQALMCDRRRLLLNDVERSIATFISTMRTRVRTHTHVELLKTVIDASSFAPQTGDQRHDCSSIKVSVLFL
jgi:hypothetical protein